MKRYVATFWFFLMSNVSSAKWAAMMTTMFNDVSNDVSNDVHPNCCTAMSTIRAAMWCTMISRAKDTGELDDVEECCVDCCLDCSSTLLLYHSLTFDSMGRRSYYPHCRKYYHLRFALKTACGCSHEKASGTFQFLITIVYNLTL